MNTGNNPSHTRKTETGLSAPRVKSPKKRKAKTRFQNLWEEAEKSKEENRLLEQSLEQLVIRIRTEIGPHERELGLSLRRQLAKLIVFAGRKSLTQWQRAVLDEWIMSSMSTLEAMGLVDNQLLDSLARLQAKEFDIAIDEQSVLSASEQLREAITERMQEELLDEQEEEPDPEWDEYDEEGEVEFADWYNEQMRLAGLSPEDLFDEPAQQKRTGVEHKKTEDSQTLFKTLFHRVARALHPDKVSDPEEREIRQALMTKLLAARRNQDLMSVFELYREHVDADAEFGDQELAELEEILIEFIARQNEQRTDLIMRSHTHQMVYEFFYSKSPSVIERNINRKIRDIGKRKAQIDTFTDTVTSLKALKPYLEHRYDELLVLY